GARFAPLERNALRSLSRFIVGEYLQQSLDISRLIDSENAVRIDRPESIARLLQVSAVNERRPLHVFRAGSPLPCRIRISSLPSDASGAIEGIVSGGAAGIPIQGEHSLLLPGRSSVVLF